MMIIIVINEIFFTLSMCVVALRILRTYGLMDEFIAQWATLALANLAASSQIASELCKMGTQNYLVPLLRQYIERGNVVRHLLLLSLVLVPQIFSSDKQSSFDGLALCESKCLAPQRGLVVLIDV
jgi:hypothetical protein